MDQIVIITESQQIIPNTDKSSRIIISVIVKSMELLKITKQTINWEVGFGGR